MHPAQLHNLMFLFLLHMSSPPFPSYRHMPQPPVMSCYFLNQVIWNACYLIIFVPCLAQWMTVMMNFIEIHRPVAECIGCMQNVSIHSQISLVMGSQNYLSFTFKLRPLEHILCYTTVLSFPAASVCYVVLLPPVE